MATREESVELVRQAWTNPGGQVGDGNNPIDARRLAGMREQLGRVWPALAEAVTTLIDSTG